MQVVKQVRVLPRFEVAELWHMRTKVAIDHQKIEFVFCVKLKHCINGECNIMAMLCLMIWFLSHIDRSSFGIPNLNSLSLSPSNRKFESLFHSSSADTINVSKPQNMSSD